MKYQKAAPHQDSWFGLKLDILFQVSPTDPISLRFYRCFLISCVLQMYLCVLREATGIENDKLPENASELRFVHDHGCCSRIDALMETHRSYYVTNIELGTVDARYEQQRKALMNAFDTFDGTSTEGTKRTVLNKSKAFQLLQTHRVVVFKQSIVTFLQEVEEKVSIFLSE